jgi:hypothetical protein
MSRHYKKNAYSPVNRTQHIGAQSAEHESPRETKQTLPPKRREQKGWKCDECGIVLKDNHKMLHIHYGRILCTGCYAEQPGKKHRKQKGRRSYKRFIERYGKEWRRRCEAKKE